MGPTMSASNWFRPFLPCFGIPARRYYHGPLTIYVKLRLRMRRECRERFSRHRRQRKPLVNDLGMHHGTCVTHVPWRMSGSRAGEKLPAFPAHVQPVLLRTWKKAHEWHFCECHHMSISRTSHCRKHIFMTRIYHYTVLKWADFPLASHSAYLISEQSIIKITFGQDMFVINHLNHLSWKNYSYDTPHFGTIMDIDQIFSDGLIWNP